MSQNHLFKFELQLQIFLIHKNQRKNHHPTKWKEVQSKIVVKYERAGGMD